MSDTAHAVAEMFDLIFFAAMCGLLMVINPILWRYLKGIANIALCWAGWGLLVYYTKPQFQSFKYGDLDTIENVVWFATALGLILAVGTFQVLFRSPISEREVLNRLRAERAVIAFCIGTVVCLVYGFVYLYEELSLVVAMVFCFLLVILALRETVRKD